MKKIILFIVFVVFSISGYSQVLKQPSEGKSMVYFTRQYATGVAVGFKIYDNEVFVGNLRHRSYIAYECSKGKHVFVTRSENTDFLEADLEEGKIYIVELDLQTGIATARVKFMPLNPNDKKFEKKKEKLFKFLTKKEEKGKDIVEDREGIDPDMEPSAIMKKYESKKAKNKITLLTTDMNIVE